jgi:catechol 2,3-dioxygenase
MYVQDLEAMLAFYTRIMGFEITDRGALAGPGGPQIVFLSQVATDHHQLAMVGTRKASGPSNSVNHFAFRVASLDEVKTFIRRLAQDGRATNVAPLTHGNAWSVYFNDPEGNGIEVFCDTPWHVAQPQATPWDPSLDNDAIHAWTRARFENEPGFGPIETFYRERERSLERAQ